uniref:Beta-1,4-N-acetylglucosamine oligosaccharide alpha-1,6-L-fucosyltransferase NodZ n=1 Tax=Candidatus Kentrum sp. DK TaxID=2126562 RepID=A0A450STE8_9GAMM|nr:MAG: beta-1,4-N-acetylglucosamine oligosaccharide alpha-1,6-L-fucosyltransferase NodZ [Candidatus Kentron sp. DK]
MNKHIDTIGKKISSYLLLATQYLSLSAKHPRSVTSYRTTGLGDCLIAGAHAWYYAKTTNRTLILDWMPSRYLPDKTANAFRHFFIAPEKIDGVPVVARARSRSKPFHVLFREVCPPSQERAQWMNDLVREGREVKDRHLCFNECLDSLIDSEKLKPFFDALQPRPEFQTEIDAFAERHFRGKQVIGLHVRYYSPNLIFSNHTPYWQDARESLEAIRRATEKAIEEVEGADYVIFLATDAKPVRDFMMKSFTGKVVGYDKPFGAFDTRELHDELPVETAQATIVDMFLLARADILIRFPPIGSWFSHYASLYVPRSIAVEMEKQKNVG